jgi:hypothetical protein
MRLVLLALVALVVAMSVSTVVHYLDWRAHGAACAAEIHPVPVEKWRGGNAPTTRMPAGCP